MITLWRDAVLLFLACGTIAGKGVNLGPCCYHGIYDGRNFIYIFPGNRSHDDGADTRFIQHGHLFQRSFVRTRLAEPIMGLLQTVNGH